MKQLWAIFLCAALIGAVGCGSGGDDAASGDSSSKQDRYAITSYEVLKLALGAQPESLDPNLSSDIASAWVHAHTFEPLVKIDAKAQPVPGVAESWEKSADYREWTFKLRENAKWHNGDPVTAHDFVYSAERILKPEVGANYAMMVYNFLDGGEEYYNAKGTDPEILGIRAIDDLTLEIRLSGPTPYFLSLLQHNAWLPLHKPTVEEHGSRWIEPENFVGNGPYELADVLQKDKVVLQKATNYWDNESVNFETIELYMIEDLQTELADFNSGGVDMITRLTNREVDNWRGKPEYRDNPIIGIAFTAMNNRVGPTSDPAIRRAMSLAINRELLVERITKLGEQPALGIIPRGMMMSDGESFRDKVDPVIPQRSYAENLQEAKRILREAGYKVDDGDTGKPLPRIEYIYNTNDLNKEVAETLQQFWIALGLEIQLQNLEWTTLLQRLRNQDFEIGRSTWIGDFMDPLTFVEIFETGHAKNGPGFSDERYDELLEKARLETDLEKRIGYFEEMEEILIEETVAVAPMYDWAAPYVIRANLKGLIRTPLGTMDASRAYFE